MALGEDRQPSVSPLRLMVSLLLAGLICGVMLGYAYCSLLLFALVEAVGIPVTASLAAILLMKVEQSTVFRVSGWRPAALPMILAALPATAVALGLRGLFDWNSWLGIVFSVVTGLITQAVVLRYLAVAIARKAARRQDEAPPARQA